MKTHARPSMSRLGRAARSPKQCVQRGISAVTRQRVTDLWSPRPKVESDVGPRNATSLLVDAGYIRQAYAGIFQLLPLGLRVLTKLEALIDKHMQSVGASKVSLSAISAQGLWQTSGRLENSSEMFKFKDRSGSKWLLAPTHEEEITTLLRNEIIAEQHLPVRLYQIGRKYRDEQRPRGGLLRGREFIMKDLYTFDSTPEHAAETYQAIRQAYRNFFTELAVPFVEARADSGNMGGDLSHEFHFPDQTGEDTVIACNSCGSSRNEEFVPATERVVSDILHPDRASESPASAPGGVRDYISADDGTLTRVILPVDAATGLPYASTDINTFAVKEAMSDLTDVNTGVEEHQAVQRFEEHMKRHKKDHEMSQLVYLIDKRVTPDQIATRTHQDFKHYEGLHTRRLIVQSTDDASNPVDLISVRDGEPCPECGNALTVQKAIEIGHTFHLGTRYSSKLDLTLLPKHKGGARVPVEMGCHGIGVTRLLAASVSCLSDKAMENIVLPRAIAPYDVAICTGSNKPEVLEAACQLYDALAVPTAARRSSKSETLDIVLDDRMDRNYGKKLKEAKFIGYTTIVMLGNALEKGMAQIICPSLAIEEDVPLDTVIEKVHGYLGQLDEAPTSPASSAPMLEGEANL